MQEPKEASVSKQEQRERRRMDGDHAPHSNQHPPPPSPSPLPEREGSFNYDIESMDGGGWRGAGRYASSDALLRYDDDGPREPLLRKRTMNTTSQIAIVGANVFPIESLDYE